ncbi:MAG: hypothetical protein IJ379_10700 [Lachnospiraceae bacterium]|nr:hypothetical protein [Lachnospiraceae bacterium]
MCKGYLTIYVSLTMTIMLALCLTLIEGARRSTIRLETECVVDIAMNSVLAEYHKELFNQYNLFYIDSSYGSNYPSYYNTEARLRYYLEQNMNLKEVSYIDFLYKDLVGMELEAVYLKQVALATDGNGVLFQKRAAEAVKDDVGVTLVENVLDWVETVEDKELMEQDMEEQKEAADEQLQAFYGTQKELADKQWIQVEISDPTQHLDDMRAKGVLKWVVAEDTLLSGQKVDLNQYLSARKRRGDINQGNVMVTEQLSVMERIWFQEYLLRYCGHFGQEKENSLLKYQAEYLVAGEAEDTENLRQVVHTICGMREVANVLYLTSSVEKSALIELVAGVLATAVFCPEAAPAFEAVLVLGWGYAESLYDTKVLLAGGEVPLLKDDDSWHYDLDSILDSFSIQMEEETQQGMSYTDYLHVLLYLLDADQTTYRFMDLMEMDIRLTEGNEAFRMDGCIESIEVEARIKSGYGYGFQITRQKKY